MVSKIPLIPASRGFGLQYQNVSSRLDYCFSHLSNTFIPEKKNQQRSHLTTFKKEDFLSWVKWIFKLTTTKSDSKSESDWVPRCLTALQVDCGDKSPPPFYYWGGNVLTKLTLTPFCFSFLPSYPLFFFSSFLPYREGGFSGPMCEHIIGKF